MNYSNIYLVGEKKLVDEWKLLLEKYSIPISSQVERNSIVIELTICNIEQKKKNISTLSDKTCLPIFSTSVVNTISEQVTWTQNKNLIGISAFPTLTHNHLIEVAFLHNYDIDENFQFIENFFLALQKKISIVKDSVGMVFPRIVSMLINEAFFTYEENVASKDDIDLAMKLGTNYPFGLFEWCETIGSENIVKILETLNESNANERYKISQMLLKNK